MSSHIGIEISRSACRIVELDASAGESATTVRSYAQSTAADAVTLAPFRRRQAAVVVWGLHAEHRQAEVTSGSYLHMRRDAVSAMKHAGVDTRQMLADMTLVDARKDAYRRTVVVALAKTSDVAAALRALTSGGVRVRSIVTPALALMSLARMRRRVTKPGALEAYVAFEEFGTAIALVRDAALVAARELDWGYQAVRGARSRQDAATQLADAITAFFRDCGAQPGAVSQICICGGLPELRTMTLSLMERLDVEVEPLDSLFGIDDERLPEPSDDFRERVVDLRIAWAVAADWNAPIDFLRERRRRTAKTALTRAAVVAGVATGVAVAWRLQRSWIFDAAATPPTKTASAPPSVTTNPAPVPQRASPPPPIVRSETRPALLRTPLAPLTVQPAIQQPSRTPVLVLTPVPPPATPAFVQPEPVPPPPSPTMPRRASAVAASARPTDETALPFDASLGTILYGAERKLAIIDGRIVQVGDDIHGSRVVDITPDAVLFRDVQGRLRKLTLQDSRR